MFKGTFTAIVTPFQKDELIDKEAFKKLIEFQINNKVNGIVPVGTTGESPTLNHKEHNEVISIAVEQAKGKIKVIAGTGSNSTVEAIIMTEHAKDVGADASLQVCPYYNKPTQKGFYEHFAKIAKIDIPIIIYNIPGRTGKNLETKTLMKLANEFSNIVGVKEASGSLPQMMDVIASRPKGFTVLSGDDNMTFPLICAGGNGVVSVASNIVPDRISKMVNEALQGDIKKARQLHYELLPLFKAMFLETNPIPIKAALAMKGLIKEAYRLPMYKMSDENKNKLKEVLNKLNIL